MRANLIVNYLPASIGDADLRELFAEYGNIVNSKVVKDKEGNSKCFGFVKFAEEEQAIRAREQTDGKELFGKKIKVSFAEPQDKKKANLYVGGLPVFYGEEEIRKLFDEGVVDVKIMRDHDGTSKGVAFVQIADVEIAKKAIDLLNDAIPPKGSSRIVVRFSDKDKRSKEQNEAVNLPQMMGYTPYGQPIIVPAPAAYGPAKRKGSNRGGHQQMPQIQQPVHMPYAQYQVPYYAASSAPSIFSMPMPGMNANVPSIPGSNQAQYAGVCLFIYHIPLDCTEQLLYSLFSSYGFVSNVRIPRDPSTGSTKGYAFVNLSSHQEALNAIAGLNGYAIGNKRLKVSFKNDSNS